MSPINNNTEVAGEKTTNISSAAGGCTLSAVGDVGGVDMTVEAECDSFYNTAIAGITSYQNALNTLSSNLGEVSAALVEADQQVKNQNK